MAVENDDDGGIELNEEGPALRPMSPERAKERASVLAAMEAGADDPKAVKRSKKAELVAKGSTRAAKALAKAEKATPKGRSSPSPGDDDRPAPARKPKPLVADADDPANDDPSDYEGDDEDGIVAGTEDSPKPKKKAPARDLDDDEDEDTDDEDTDVDLSDDDDETSAADDDDETPAERKKVKNAIAKIANQEKRAKERIRELDRTTREEFERHRGAFLREWEPKVKVAQEHEALTQRAKSNPVGTALEFARTTCGITGDDWEILGKTFFLQSPRAQQDPAKREQALRQLAQVESKSELQQVKEQHAALLRKLDERDQQEQNERMASRYLRQATQAITPERTPLTRRLFKSDPEELRARLHELSIQLAERSDDGMAPSPARLVRVFEKRQRRELERLGVDPDSVTKQRRAAPASDEDDDPPRKKTGTQPPAGKKKQQGQVNGKPQTGRDLKAAVLAEMEAGRA